MKHYVGGFVGAYYLALWAAWQFHRDVLMVHWPLIAAFEYRIGVGLFVAPWISALLSVALSGLNLRSYTALGDGVLTLRKALLLGWISTLIANWMVVIVLLRTAIEKSHGAPWMEAIGVERFNLTFNLAIPTIAFLGAHICIFVGAALREEHE